TSYFWMMDLDTDEGRSDQVVNVTPKKDWVKTLNCEQPGATDLVVDATLSDGQDANRAKFDEVHGGSWDRYGLPDGTNHMNRRVNPDGGNVLYVDGHNEWRPFSQMGLRWIPPWNFPYHWW
ncbi:MAG: hypothetical protein JSU70_03595, partial [Phycisphaerales bacterium]